MATVSFEGVGKVFPDGTPALQGLDLEIGDGELMVLVGPSGCGKTTALRMVAGLEEISKGRITIDGVPINDLDPSQRDVAMVFQNYALYPHMNVFENIAFPLRSRRVPKREVTERVERTATLLGLRELLKRRPRSLSGGQRQRVAMGRAIVRQPRVFLMDEPLSNLDAKLRAHMRAEITTLQRDLKVTTIYVTHDQVEAMTMGTRIAVMRKGVLQQQGTPEELYRRPANLFVASFIGSPAMNLVRGRVEATGRRLECIVGGQRLPLPASHRGLAAYAGRELAVGARPEYLRHVPGRNGHVPTLEGEVTLVESLGAEKLVHVGIAADPVVTDQVLEGAGDTDAAVVAAPFIARFDGEVDVEAGRPTRIAVAPEHLHFFDLESGRSLR